jgi:hypothetical protein
METTTRKPVVHFVLQTFLHQQPKKFNRNDPTRNRILRTRFKYLCECEPQPRAMRLRGHTQHGHTTLVLAVPRPLMGSLLARSHSVRAAARLPLDSPHHQQCHVPPNGSRANINVSEKPENHVQRHVKILKKIGKGGVMMYSSYTLADSSEN